MNRKMKGAFAAGLILVSAMLTPFTKAYAADGSRYEYEGYVYDSWGVAQRTPAAFRLATVIDSASMEDFEFASIDDVTCSEDGRIFICDRLSGRVNVFTAEGDFIQSVHVLKELKDGQVKIALNPDKSQMTLSQPTGSWFHAKNNELYIADSGNRNVYVLDGDTFYIKRVISQPAGMTGATEYVPSKVTVDLSDRIYIIVSSSYEGIVELNPDGTFSRYFGVNEPTVNLVQYFWKSIATDVQKEKIGKTYAPGFTNVALDNEGFVFAVTKETNASTKLFRLNANGENVIRSENFDLIGDLTVTGGESQFIDVSVNGYSVTAVLDSTRGRIFLYDYDGYILNIFGGYGYSKGQFRNPTSLAWCGNNLIVTDSDLRCAYILTPTPFGEAALNASEQYYYGNWEEATGYFEECLKLNANYELGYIGVGKNLLMQNRYEEAMYNFKLGNDRNDYTLAYNGYRAEQIREHFWIVAVLFVALITLLVLSEVRYHKKKPKGEENDG